ncbi:Protein SNA4 [Nakaseomyces bracarensis]|uniref:Protein SNA4 n=1 Tax=Nakaseomyces bracarensis TaxID=273131 RepID=A0ABR4NPV2_9SACH
MCCTFTDILLIILAFFLPPVAVGLRSGLASSELWLNVILTIVGGVPGVIHAIYYILKTSSRSESRYDEFSEFYQRGWADRERLISNSPPASTGQDLRPNPLPEAPFKADDILSTPLPPQTSSDQKSKKAKDLEARNPYIPDESTGTSSRGYDIQTPLLDNPDEAVPAPPPYSQS